ncbi:MAG: ComEA family DNA-binding protein [Gemmatimonadota bacterium]
MHHRLLYLLALLTPSERKLLAFLVGWALLGALASVLPWTAGFATDAREPVRIPADDPRAEPYAKSAALAAHLELARTPPPVPLDPNLAPVSELDRLPGIGPRTALRWVSVRETTGPFFAPEDLCRVKGLGPARVAAVTPHLRFPPEARVLRAKGQRLVELNRATQRDLEALPGVGPVLARALVSRRAARGRYRSLADLDSVPGVGPALLRELAARVSFE